MPRPISKGKEVCKEKDPSRNPGEMRTQAACLLCLGNFLGVSGAGEVLPERCASGCFHCRSLHLLVPEMNPLPPSQQVPAVTPRVRYSDDDGCLENYSAYDVSNARHR